MPFDVDELFTDEKSENEGVWVDAGEYNPTLAGLELKVARLMNPAMSRMLQEEIRSAGPAYDKDEQLQITVMVKVYAATVLRGWRGLTQDGKAVKYTPELCEEYLARSTDLRNVVSRIAQDRQRYRVAREGDDRKN